MSSKPTHLRSALFVLTVTFPLTLFAAEQMAEIQAWLEKMQQAIHTRNYIGTFVYGQRDQLSSVKIIHRVTASGEQERLISMDGTGRQVVRNGNKVTCVMPDRKAVVVGKARPGKQFPPVFPLRLDTLTDYYTFTLSGLDKVAGRVTQRISISPRDKYRYGHQLWVDKETGLLLKTLLLNERGKPIEQFVFTNIKYVDTIADELLDPDLKRDEFTWYRDQDIEGDNPAKKMRGMLVSWLPPGFKHDMQKMQKLSTNTMPVEHMVFSDGLASISVFIEEELQHDPANLIGGSRIGAISAHGRSLGEYHVTVVGEVPHITVQKISDSVEYSGEND